MEFSRTEYWSGTPFPSPGIEARSPALQADSLPAEPQWSPLMGIYPDKTNSKRYMHPYFQAALFTVAKTWKHPRCPLTKERIKMWWKDESVSCTVVSFCLWHHGLWSQNPPGSSVHGILQERIQEWVGISFSRASSQSRDQTQVSYIACKFFTIWATEDVVHIYNRILLSHKKEWNNAIYSNIDGPCHIEWNKSDREREISCIIYVWNLKWHKWAYLWNRSRLSENRLVVAKGEGVWRVMGWEIGLADISCYM